MITKMVRHHARDEREEDGSYHWGTVPDCIDRVTSQNRDRAIFERLATPRPALQVTLKSNWLSQQQQQPQQPTFEEGVNSSWKQRATWESKAGVRDETKNATEVEIASRKLVGTVSKVDVGTHLSEQEVIADPFSNNEANTQKFA